MIIPCFNESAALQALVARCLLLVHARDDVEVIFVDNGSTDDTKALLTSLTAASPQLVPCFLSVNAGYGGGILAGLRLARGEVLGWTHADGQTDPFDLLEALDMFGPKMRSTDWFLKGQRHDRAWADRVWTMGMTAFASTLFQAKLWDINAQPTFFPRAQYAHWRDPPTDFSLDLYAFVMARRLGAEILRFPVRFVARAHGTSRWNTSFAAKLGMAKRTLTYSIALSRRRL